MLVLTPPDALADIAAWRRRACTPTRPSILPQAMLPDGERSPSASRWPCLDHPAAPWFGHFACQHLRPEQLRAAPISDATRTPRTGRDVWISGDRAPGSPTTSPPFVGGAGHCRDAWPHRLRDPDGSDRACDRRAGSKPPSARAAASRRRPASRRSDDPCEHARHLRPAAAWRRSVSACLPPGKRLRHGSRLYQTERLRASRPIALQPAVLVDHLDAEFGRLLQF